jgi:CHASE2 domain
MFKTGPQMLLLVGLFFQLASQQPPAAAIDQAFADWLSLNGPQTASRQPAAVTLVAINDSSVTGTPWPWSPLPYSLFVRASLPFKPDVVAIDEILDWKSAIVDPGERQKLPQYEKLLGDTLIQCPKLLLLSRLGWPEDPQVIPPLQEAPLVTKISGDLRRVPEWTAIEHQPKEEYRLMGTVGFTPSLPGAGAIDSVPLLLRYQGEVVPSFVLQAVLLWDKLSCEDVTVVLGSHIALGDKLRIPIDETGAMRVNFGAPRGLIGFDDLLLAAEQADAKRKPSVPVEQLRGGIALLARTDLPSQTLPLAMGRKGSEGELFSAAIATIQLQAFLRRVPAWFDFVLIGAAALVSLWIPGWRKRPVAIGAGLALLVYALAALAFFSWKHIGTPAVLPLGLAVFIALYRAATPNQPLVPPPETHGRNSPAKRRDAASTLSPPPENHA